MDLRLVKYHDDDSYVTAAILDPRFKLHSCQPEIIEQKVVVELNSKTVNVEPKAQAEEPFQPPKRDRIDIFSFMPPSTPIRKRNPSSAANEVDLYMNEPCIEMEENPLKYLEDNYHRLPILIKLRIWEKFLPFLLLLPSQYRRENFSSYI